MSFDEFDRDKEHMIVLGLKRNCQLKFIDVVSVGSLTGTVVSAREVFRRAIHLATHSLLIAHNHPSGNTNPSVSDQQITKRLREAGVIIDILLLDHIIYSIDETEGYYSFADEGKL